MVAGEGIASPTRRDIDGKYLDQNEQDLKTRYIKFQKDWPLFGVTFRQKIGEYSSEMAMRMTMDPKTSPCKSYSV